MPEDNAAITPSIPPVDPNVAPVVEQVSSAPEPAAPAEAPVDSKSSTVVEPTLPPADSGAANDGMSIYAAVAEKIRNSRNVLIALSSDPSVDEMAAAIGLSIYLDKLGKRATAIYSGTTPNALEFLKPEETFESTADTLQDFVIALNKDKADHLRYKLDGDYVKIYITPYKTRISEEDLDFSYGDFNVDLVLALDVSNGIDLDSALREHGRIMHDASVINITTGNPGKFGEIEWSDKHASSVSEMLSKLIYDSDGAKNLGKEEATAFLTGIVAATNRFSSASTTPETMQIASKLMKSGANQQLVSKNITSDIENEMFSLSTNKATDSALGDQTNLDVLHGNEEDNAEVDATITEKESTLLDDLKAAEESLAQAGAETTPEASRTELKIDSENNTSNLDEVANESDEPRVSENSVSDASVEPSSSEAVETEPASVAEPVEPVEQPTAEPVGESAAATVTGESAPVDAAPSVVPDATEGQAQEKVLQPSGDFGSASTTLEDENKYGKMLEDALDSVNGVNEPAMPAVPAGNPAAMSAPVVPEAPEVNGVPEMNYMPMPGEEILPPPPAPPIDMSGAAMPSEAVVASQPVAPVAPAIPNVAPIEPAAPVVEPAAEPLGDQPAMQDQVYGPQSTDPSAFKIPGM